MLTFWAFFSQIRYPPCSFFLPHLAINKSILLDKNSTAHPIAAEVGAIPVSFQSRELDAETNPGVGVKGHLLDHAVYACLVFRRRRKEVAAPGDASVVGEAVASLVQRKLAECLQEGTNIKIFHKNK
jgi:hypothetical protein